MLRVDLMRMMMTRSDGYEMGAVEPSLGSDFAFSVTRERIYEHFFASSLCCLAAPHVVAIRSDDEVLDVRKYEIPLISLLRLGSHWMI